MSKAEIGCRLRLMDKIMVGEEFFKKNYMKISLTGNEENLKEFFATRCRRCVVRNITSTMDNVGKGVHRATCVVDYEVEAARECIDYVEDDEVFVVPEDNWFEASPEIMDLLERIARGDITKVGVSEDLVMRKTTDNKVGIIDVKNIVLLIGRGGDVFNFYARNCHGCRANSLDDDTIIDVGKGEIYYMCQPLEGRRRNCNFK